MRCLNCWRELSLSDTPFGKIYKCECGLDYTVELIDSSDKKEWLKIRLFRLFKLIKYPDGKKTLMAYRWKGKIIHPLLYRFFQFLGLNQFDFKGRRS